MTWLMALLLALTLGCSKHTDAAVALGSTTAPSAHLDRAAPSAAPVTTRLRQGLAWFEDNIDAAFAAARKTGRVVLVDLWAPWCHTCLSMQNFVLTAENLPTVKDRFVWLSVDTERPENADFLRRFPVGVWPTFYALSAERSEVLGRWLGAASPAQFARFLQESERTGELRRHGPLASNEPLALLVSADELATRGAFAQAADAYAKVLALAAPDWPRRPETLVAQMTALYKAKAESACLALAEAGIEQTGDSASAVDFAGYALECAGSGAKHGPAAERVRRAVESKLSGLCFAGSPQLSPDDRADACDKLAEARTGLGDAQGARAATVQRLSVLERAAAGKPDEVSLAYDWALTDTLITLGRAEDALERNILRERALPDNYNPPQYQARIYKELGRWKQGLAAIDRARALAYGPRRIGLLSLKADLLLAAGRKDEARKVIAAELEEYRALPAGQKQPAAEARAEQRLAHW